MPDHLPRIVYQVSCGVAFDVLTKLQSGLFIFHQAECIAAASQAE